LLRFVPAWFLMPSYIGLVVAGAVAAHLLLEKPLLRAVRRLSESKPAGLMPTPKTA
jgi:hypothetical protein